MKKINKTIQLSIASTILATVIITPAHAEEIVYKESPEITGAGATLLNSEENQKPQQSLTATTFTPTNGTLGMDVSSWQPTVNWNNEYNKGARFAYIKVSEGTTYLSPTFKQQYSGATNANILRGGYHFALPSVSNGQTQANYFINNGGGWTNDGKTLTGLLDLEWNPYKSLGNTCYDMTKQQLTQWVTDFTETYKQKTGRYPAIYTANNWWNQCVGNTKDFSHLPLHIVNYSTTPGNIPTPWKTYDMWQYSDNNIFAGDSNIYNGTYEELKNFTQNKNYTTKTQQLEKPTYRVINGIATFYYNNGGINKFGEPINNEASIIHNGAWQGFSKNYNLYWHDRTGTQSVFMNGAIGRVFKNLGSENFGYPVNSETLTNVNGGVYQEFLNPSNNNRNVIYWSNNTGAYTMFKNGAIYNYWANNGGLQGIGYPITNETVRANGIITQEFVNGNGARTVLSWSDSTGVKVMNGNGDIYNNFINKGGYATIGAPTTNQVVRNNGIVTQEFVNSRGVKSVFSWTAGTGAKVMNGNGDIYKNFINKGGYATFGTPLTDEYLVNNSIVAQDFVKGNLKYRAYWSVSTGTSFVYMNGGIYWHWANNGGVDKLGIPVTNELVDSQGRVYQKFSKSGKVVTVYWTSSRGAWIQ